MLTGARQSLARRWPEVKLLLVRFLGSYATAAEAAAHFGGAFALLTLLGGTSHDVALSTSALIAASAVFDQRFAKRVAVLEAKMEVAVREDQARQQQKDEEASR